MQKRKKYPILKRSEKRVSLSNMRIYFIGIGGVSMYSLARLAQILSADVLGSDIAENSRTSDLSALGIKIYNSQTPENITPDIDLVVYSNAITEKNAELARAISLGIKTQTRAEFLGMLMRNYDYRIGVSGTHGKSTTTAMINAIFDKAEAPHTTLAGEDLPGTSSPLLIGGNDTLIYEACEYKDAFLSFSPHVSVALNMEMDHVDYFKSDRQLEDSFTKALSLSSECAMINSDDAGLRRIKNRITSPVITFGASHECDYRYEIISVMEHGYKFLLYWGGNTAELEIHLRGAFNVTNATAAAAVALECGISIEDVSAALSEFCGIKRRLELIGEYNGAQVFYDYAHHPTEIRASLNALRRETKEPLTVVFKPHTYTRTAYFLREFAQALSLADRVIVTNIYPAREEAILGVTAEALAMQIGKGGVYSPDDEVTSVLEKIRGGIIVLMGAGDMSEIKDKMIFNKR